MSESPESPALPASPVPVPVEMSDSDSSDDNGPRTIQELALIRERNIRERDAFFATLIKDNPEFAEIMGPNFLNPNAEKKVRIKKRGGDDPSLSFRILVPLERRRSARLENKPPIFTKDDLVVESTFKRDKRDHDDCHDLEEIVYPPRRTRTTSKRNTDYKPSIAVEDVTDMMIENIAKKVSIKVYSDAGTSCHQCRQKTIDQKTCCRSSSCVGVRGQFCGVCLENRYGEDAATALKDPDWHCPVCRGICNCSFCRTKAGKRPTGVLTPQALQAGHKSVKDFLDSLRGEGDYPHQDNSYKTFKDPKCLLGFSEDLTTAHMGGDTQHKMDLNLTLDNLKMFCKKKEDAINDLVKQHEEANNLLGFVKPSGDAQLSNNVQCKMQSYISLKDFENFLQLKQKEIGLLKEDDSSETDSS